MAVTAMLSIGGSVFLAGQQLGKAEAMAAWWERYATGLEKRCE